MIKIELEKSCKPIVGVYIGIERERVHIGRKFLMFGHSNAWIIRQIDGKQVKLLMAVYLYVGPLCIGLLTHWKWKNVKHDFAAQH